MCQWQRQASADGVTINTEINSRFTETGTTEDKKEKKKQMNFVTLSAPPQFCGYLFPSRLLSFTLPAEANSFR